MASTQSQDIAARSGNYTIAVALVAGLGGLMFGYDIGVIADAKDGIRKVLGLGEVQVEVVVSSVLAGSFLGALLAGRLCDKIGRRWTNVWGGALFAIGCLGCCFAQDFAMIVVARILMGMGVGFSSVAGPLYIAEISAPWSRGAMVSIYQLAITVGIFLAFLVGLYFTPRGLWRASFGTGSVLGLGLIIGMLAMPPSPRWLVGKGRTKTALGVLKRTMGSAQGAESELKAIQDRVKQETGMKLLQALRSSPAVRLALILAIGLAFLQQASGINAIFYYAPEILVEIGLGESKLTLTAALGLINVLATFIAIWLVDRVGRRPLLVVGTALMLVAQLVIGVAAFWLPESAAAPAQGAPVPAAGIIILISIFVAIIAFAFSLGPLVWLVISEIFPAGVRSACVGIATSANWVGNFLIAQGSLSILNHLGTTVAFWIFAGFNAFTVFFVLWRMPETKGVELEEIENFFTEKK